MKAAMTQDEREDRIVFAFERAALALEEISHTVAGIHDLRQREFDKQYPAREKREAIVSRVPTDEDRIREQHGASDEPLTGWLDINGPGLPDGKLGEYIGRREREFLSEEEKRTGAESSSAAGPSGGSTEAAESTSE